MAKKPGKPNDLTKGSSKKNSPELSERDLTKVSGGLKISGIEGESATKDHKLNIG